jgi:hypothetical protein
MARKTLKQLLDELAPGVKEAFEKSVANMRSDIQFEALIEALANQDIEGAMRIIRLSAEYYAPLDRAMRNAYEEGGDFFFDQWRAQAKRQRANVTVGRFDGRSPRSEQFLRQQSSKMIVGDVPRDTIREILRGNMEAGTSPRKAALDLAGRMNKVTGRREGGIIGLTDQQAGWVNNARMELEGTPKTMEAFLQRKARDRRFDATIRKAIREGRTLTPTEVNRMIGRYSDNLLQVRAEAIARTELLSAMHEAQAEGLRQLIERGEVRSDQITQEWDASGDDDTRQSHRSMDGQKRKQGEPFVTGNGHLMLYPGDRSLGAPGSEIVQCRCRVSTDIDFLADLT